MCPYFLNNNTEISSTVDNTTLSNNVNLVIFELLFFCKFSFSKKEQFCYNDNLRIYGINMKSSFTILCLKMWLNILTLNYTKCENMCLKIFLPFYSSYGCFINQYKASGEKVIRVGSKGYYSAHTFIDTITTNRGERKRVLSASLFNSIK